MSLWEARPAKVSAWQDCDKDLKTPGETSHLSILGWLISLDHRFAYGKTCPESLAVTEGEISLHSSQGWGNWGMGGATECLTAHGWEGVQCTEGHGTKTQCLNDAGGSSLSAVLQETHETPQKYWLSSRACAGILRRAESRDKTLPTILKTALENQRDQ